MDTRPTAVVCWDTLRDATGGDSELALELAQLYASDGALRIAAMERALSEADIVRLGRLAHGMRGSSAALGAGQAADAFERLEEMARGGSTQGFVSALAMARGAFEDACAALRESGVRSAA